MGIDVDHFKEANDSYRHAVRYALLCEVARRTQAAAVGAFLARIGGDEFTMIVMDSSQPDAALTLAERLLATFNDDFEAEGYLTGRPLPIADYAKLVGRRETVQPKYAMAN